MRMSARCSLIRCFRYILEGGKATFQQATLEQEETMTPLQVQTTVAVLLVLSLQPTNITNGCMVIDGEESVAGSTTTDTSATGTSSTTTTAMTAATTTTTGQKLLAN